LTLEGDRLIAIAYPEPAKDILDKASTIPGA